MPETSAPLKPQERLERAEAILGHAFTDRELLRRALTHPSACEDRNPSNYYERLEFLGDSVLGFFIAEEVYHRFPQMPEGGMTRIKVSIVAGSVLSAVARDLGIADTLFLGESVRGTGGRGMTSALENTLEALVAALYLDAGADVARKWVLSVLGHLIQEEVAATPENPKSLLQELLQTRGESPVYRLLSHEGPPHDRVFTVTVETHGQVIGKGSGRSKKEAEAHAAAQAISGLDNTADTA